MDRRKGEERTMTEVTLYLAYTLRVGPPAQIKYKAVSYILP